MRSLRVTRNQDSAPFVRRTWRRGRLSGDGGEDEHCAEPEVTGKASSLECRNADGRWPRSKPQSPTLIENDGIFQEKESTRW
jgi:hypothetical protein